MGERKELELPAELSQQKLFAAIEDRISRRKYHDKPLEKEEISALKDDISPLEAELALSRVIFRQEGFDRAVKTILGSYGLVTGAASFATITADEKTDKFRANVEAGILGEALILAATARGWNTCWVGGMLEKGEIREQLNLEPAEKVAAITPLGEARDKLTLTEKLTKKVAGSRSRKPLEELVENYRPEEYSSWVKTALKAARLAPSAANKQPWRFRVDPAAEKITLASSRQKDNHGVSPYLDCGIALLHLLLGAGQEINQPTFRLLDPPAVAEVYYGG